MAGDLAVALATAEESFEPAEGMEPGPLSAAAAAVLACALHETGQADRSVDVLLTRAGGEERRLIGGGWRPRFLGLLTRALLATGRQAEAERAAGAAQACADAVELPSAAAMASLAAAAIALARANSRDEHSLSSADPATTGWPRCSARAARSRSPTRRIDPRFASRLDRARVPSIELALDLRERSELVGTAGELLGQQGGLP